MENPIKANRIVNDNTFARRLKGHLDQTQAGCAMGQEDLEYLRRVADKLLQWQIETCPYDEKPYHQNCDKELKW